MYNIHILYYNDHGYTEYIIEDYNDIDSIAYVSQFFVKRAAEYGEHVGFWIEKKDI